MRGGRGLGQQAGQYRHQRPVPARPVRSPGVGDATAHLSQVGSLGAVQFAQQIINAGQGITDGAYPGLIRPGGQCRPGGAQQRGDVDIQDVGNALQRADGGGVPAALLEFADDVHADVGRRREIVLGVGGFAERPDALTDHRFGHLRAPPTPENLLDVLLNGTGAPH